MSILSSGADVVYVFNHFQQGYLVPVYQEMLKAMSSLDLLKRQPRAHAVTYREVVAPGENYRPPLPAIGKKFSFSLPLGPKPDPGQQTFIILEVAVRKGCPVPSVLLNGTNCELHSRVQKNGNQVLTYSVPLEALPGKNQDVIDILAGGREIRILRVEVHIFPANTTQ